MKNAWDQIFEDESFCSDINPRPFVMSNLKDLSPADGPVLDVGCGCGRHLVYLAANGYQSYGLDLSEVALTKARQHLSRFGLDATLANSPMWEIPFQDTKFAAALSINVLNHGLPEEISKAVSAISEALLPGGLFLLTLLTTNDYRGSGKQVGPRTFICDKGPEEGILHTVFDRQSIDDLLGNLFEIETFETDCGKRVLASGEELPVELFRIRLVKH